MTHQTLAAPDRFSSAAHSESVEPVVMMSSTTITVLPAITRGRNTPKVPMTFVRRSSSDSRPCFFGLPFRRKAKGTYGFPSRFASARARYAHWL